MAKKSEYGKPTFGRSVLAKVGVGDGYGNPKKVATPYPPPKPKQERIDVSNAPKKLEKIMTEREKMLRDI